MIKINDSDKKFLNAFAKSNEWAILRARFIVPLLEEAESVTGTFKFDESYTAGERLAGKEQVSKFGRGMLMLIERFGNEPNGKKKPEDYFE